MVLRSIKIRIISIYMRYITPVTCFLIAILCILISCQKYKDPSPRTDARLTNPYCNDPAAVNYNVGFPGKPDNTVCIYPSDVFKGSYIFRDSVFHTSDNIFLFYDSVVINIDPASHSKISVTGICNSGGVLTLTAGPTFLATVDTTIGDTTVINWGQPLCRPVDTFTGTIFRDRIDTTLLHITLQVASDTGMTTHIGDARKQ